MLNALKRIFLATSLMVLFQTSVFADFKEVIVQDQPNALVLGFPMASSVCNGSGYNVALTDSFCVGGFYIFGANVLVSPGIYQQIFSDVNGCDSVVTLYLKNRLPVKQVQEVSICRGQTFLFEGITYAEAGVYNFTYQTATSCDSVFELRLSVIEPKYNFQTDSFCANSSYQFFDTLITTAGTYQHLLQSADGCDSVLVLNLVYKNPIRQTQEVSICKGGNYTFVGNIFKTAGVYSHTFPTATGCDSIVTLNLAVRPLITSTHSASFCESSIYNFGGDIISAPGVYSHLFQTAESCDSLVTLTLAQTPTRYSSIEASICPSESYYFAGRSLTLPGIYVDTLLSSIACDSVVTLTLRYSNPVSTSIAATTCKNKPYSFGHKLLSVSGIYTLNTKTTGGCDSVVTLNLKVNRTYNIVQTQTLAWNEVYEINNHAYSVAGQYTDILQSVYACDSVVSTTIVINYDNAPAVVVPKYFTPNADGINDQLEIENLNLYPNAYLEIVDRQGHLLYRMRSNSQAWDGKKNGQDMPQTDYWYKLEVPELNKSSVGHFLLKR